MLILIFHFLFWTLLKIVGVLFPSSVNIWGPLVCVLEHVLLDDLALAVLMGPENIFDGLTTVEPSDLQGNLTDGPLSGGLVGDYLSVSFSVNEIFLNGVSTLRPRNWG